MSSLTQDQEIQNFITEAPRKYTGLIMDNSLQGRANSNSIASYVLGRGLPLTMENLDAAVVALQFLLFWTAKNEPTPIAQDTRSTRAPRDTNNGVPRYEGTQYTDRANGIESSWAKDVREGREKHVADNKKRERDAQRYKETHQTVLSPNGRTNYAESNRLNEDARQRHLAEDARESGRPIPVQTGPRSIPSSETDPNYQAWLRTASADEIKIFLSRKGRSHLMR
jgi:hypothetical protein